MRPLNVLVDIANTMPRVLRSLCFSVLMDERFADAPASAGHHPGPHRERGGLALHTMEVALAAMSMSGDDEELKQLAFVAAVFHDYGKIHEYAFDAEGRSYKLPFASRVGHIAWSWAVWQQNAAKQGVEVVVIDEVSHAILAHHGRKEWGSPVEPQTRLAFIVHTADMLSARGLVEGGF